MELKNFQSLVLDRLSEYLEILKTEYQDENILVQRYQKQGQKRPFTHFCKNGWDKMAENGRLPVMRDKKGETIKNTYIAQKDGLGNTFPSVCLKVPTGGGKTLIGVNAVERVNYNYFVRNNGLVLWVVPTEAIYRQTKENFKYRSHPYRHTFDRMSAGHVKLLDKNSAFSLQDIQENLCVMLLMLQSANRETKESLKVFKDSGKFIGFFPDSNNYQANYELLSKVKNLDFHGKLFQKEGSIPHVSIKHSLGNALRIVRPIVVLDEGHRAYSDLARDTVAKLNPRFLIELSATPNMKTHKSNVLVQIGGVMLKEEEMIKIPINILNSEKGDWKKTLQSAYEKRRELELISQTYGAKSNKNIRPIMLIQVERTGKDQREKGFIHSEDAKEYLISRLRARPDEIRIKTSGRNELKDENLLSETSSVRYIITNKALQEGWDCPFAYVLAILGKSQSKQALTQLIGRILRQPYAKEIKEFPPLNECYVFCYNRVVKDVVEDIRKGLQKEGMGDVVDHVKYNSNKKGVEKQTVKRRKGKPFQEQIFLPRVLFKDKGQWRQMIYESDILEKIDYSKLSYSKLDTLTPTKLESLKTDVITLDMEDNHGNLSLFETKRKAHTAPVLHPDFLLMVQRLCQFIPHPFEAGRIWDEVAEQLIQKGVSKQSLYLSRHFILNEIQQDIKTQVEKLSEQIFTQQLQNQEICFKIFKSNLNINWAMDKEMDFQVSEPDHVLKRKNNSELQLTLFDKTYERHFNNFEKKVAWYLDESQAIKWWHRMVSRQGYHLQGWQKRKVWPDFLACAISRKDNTRYIVLETKGNHLKGNDDTKYKKKLFQLLEQYHKEPLDVGDLETATLEEQKMVFKILMEGAWQNDLNNTLNSP